MSGYEVIVFFHVLAVIVWLGGGIMFQILLARASKIGPESVASFNQAAEWTSQRVFMPSSFAALAFGIWAVIAGPYTFGEGWIIAGLVGFALSALNGSLILGPTSKKMKEAVDARGPSDPAVMRLARRIDRAGRVDLVVLILVVFNMVVKPG